MSGDPFVDSTWLMPSRTDPFFKWMLTHGVTHETGNVEAPMGWIGMVQVERDDIAEFIALEGDPYVSQAGVIDRGWYLIRQDNDGLVWAHFYQSQALAHLNFDRIDAEFGEWMGIT